MLTIGGMEKTSVSTRHALTHPQKIEKFAFSPQRLSWPPRSMFTGKTDY
jgi:hypothetical protein